MVNDLVFHKSSLDKVGASRSMYFGLLPDSDPDPDPDAIGDLSLSYTTVKNKNPLPTLFTLFPHRFCKARQMS